MVTHMSVAACYKQHRYSKNTEVELGNVRALVFVKRQPVFIKEKIQDMVFDFLFFCFFTVLS